MRWFLLSAALTVSVLASPLYADQILFKNGDHITGKIETLEAGKLVITSAVAGKVTVNVKDVKTFSSDGPITIKLTDGTVLQQKVEAGPEGQVALAPGGALQAQNVPISSVKTINFKEDWTGNVTIGGTLTRGNTDTDNFNAGFTMTRRTEQDKMLIDGGFLYGRQKVPGLGGGKHETENDWFIDGQYNYYFTPKFYGYANARVERDLIAGISLRLTPGAGVGYDWFDQPDFHFHTEGGLSWLYRQYTHGGGTAESIAARAAYHVDKKINDKVTLFHNLEYYPGLDRIDDYFFVTDAGVRATLTEKMFSEFKVQEQYDSSPAPGHGRNDTRFILGVGWTF